MKLLLILVLILSLPVLELYLLIASGSAIGTTPTLLLVVVSALFGAYALRAQGMGTLEKMERSMQYGVIPTGGLLESVFILLGGICLLLPGFITDVFGILLLVPPLRRTVLAKALQWLL